MKDFLREQFPNPERNGCPDEDILQALAEDRIAPNDPALLHVGSCSECYREYLHLRREMSEGRPKEEAPNTERDSEVLPFPASPVKATPEDI